MLKVWLKDKPLGTHFLTGDGKPTSWSFLGEAL